MPKHCHPLPARPVQLCLFLAGSLAGAPASATERTVFRLENATGLDRYVYPFETRWSAPPQLIILDDSTFLFSAEMTIAQDEVFVEKLANTTYREAARIAQRPSEQMLLVRHCGDVVSSVKQQDVLSDSFAVQFTADKRCQPSPDLLEVEMIIEWSEQVSIGPNMVSMWPGKIKKIAEDSLRDETSADEKMIRMIIDNSISLELIVFNQPNQSSSDNELYDYVQSYIISTLFDLQPPVTGGPHSGGARFVLKDIEIHEGSAVILQENDNVLVESYATGASETPLW